MQSKPQKSLAPIFFALTLIAGIALGYSLSNSTNSNSFLSSNGNTTLQEISTLIKNKYVDDINIDSINQFAIDEMLAHLDPHSVYISPAEIEAVNSHLEGRFTGIGVMYNVIDDTVSIIQLIANGPAKTAGIEVGDKIIAINDSVSLTKKNIAEDFIRSKMRGKEGSSVILNIIRDGIAKKITVKRASISVPSIDAAYMLDAKTGYIKINKFAERTYEEFMQELEKLQKTKMENLVLDLRNNGGGYMHAATLIADEFLDGDKLIVYTQGSKSLRDEKRCQKDGLFEKGKLVVLIDEASASASEVLAGALQDWDRATIIGRRSFGKGLVQHQYNLSNGGALRLTVSKYYTPLGRNIQKAYTAGKEKYMHEIIDRYNDGEIFKGDTLPKGKAYKTPKGNTVYGGGGITPDVFIGIDTNSNDKILNALYKKDIIEKFELEYYIANKKNLDKIDNIENIKTNILLTNEQLNNLKMLASNDSITITNFTTATIEKINQKIQANIALQLLGTQAYYQVLNTTDTVVNRALQVLK